MSFVGIVFTIYLLVTFLSLYRISHRYLQSIATKHKTPYICVTWQP